MWIKLLKVPAVGPQDDFFDLGGESLIAMRLILDIEARYGRRIDAAALAESPTIEAIAAMLGGASSERRVTTQVALAQGPAAPGRAPLFLFHPIGGHVFAYTELARALGAERRVVAFRALGVEGEDTPLDRVHQLAERYLSEILEHPAPAVYELAGWSFGGVIAFEVAQLLLARGAKVTLALVDSHTKPSSEALPHLDDAEVAALFASDFAGLAGKPALRQAGTASSATELLGGLRDASQLLGLEPSDVDQLFAVFRANLIAQLRYVPKRIATPLLLVRPTTRDADESSDARWREVAGAGITRLEVAGDHFTMLKAPAAGELARVLGEWFVTNSSATP